MISSIKIDTAVYSVSTTQRPIIVDRRECRGSCDFEKNEILIMESSGESRKKTTLMHEIMHALAHERGIDLSRADSEETFCDEIGRAFLQIVRDNPDLVEYIKKEE